MVKTVYWIQIFELNIFKDDARSFIFKEIHT